MKTSNAQRVRFDFTFSDGDVAYERLHLEMIEIANAHPNNPAAVAYEQKKHLLRILLAYSNGGFLHQSTTTRFRTPEAVPQIAMDRSEPTSPPSTPPAAAFDPDANVTATHTPPNLKNEFDPDFKSAAVMLPNGSAKFGDLIID